MRTLRLLTLVCLLCLVACGNRTTVVLFENDVHCAASGYAQLAGWRDAIAIADTADVAVVSSGDFLQGGTWGAETRGGAIVQLMNAVGYDVVTLGNHELDYRLARLLSLSDSLKAPVVNVNLTDLGGKPYFNRFVIKKFGHRRVAFVGVLTPMALRSESYGFVNESNQRVADLGLNIDTLVQTAVNDARAAGADVVILLSHLGEMESENPQENSVELIRRTSGIDVVLDGHSHSVFPARYFPDAAGDSVLLVQTGKKFENIGKLVIAPDGKMSAELVPTATLKVTSARVQAVYDSIDAQLSLLLDANVARSDFELVSHPEFVMRSRSENRETFRGNSPRGQWTGGQSNMADLVTDAYRRMTGAQLGFVNMGGIRAGMEAGNITYGNVVAVNPFGNDLCLLEVTGRQVLDALEIASDVNAPMPGKFLQVSGLKLRVDTGVENRYTLDSTDYTLTLVGERRVSQVLVENPDGSYSEIDPAKTYTAVTSSYVAYAGDEMKGFRGSRILADHLMRDSDALLFYVRDTLGGVIPDVYSRSQNRIMMK